MIFDKGEGVIWFSTVDGVVKENHGKFIVRIPPYIDFRPFLPSDDIPQSHIKTDAPRSEADRALVEVLQDNGESLFYTPRFSQLRKAARSLDSKSQVKG